MEQYEKCPQVNLRQEEENGKENRTGRCVGMKSTLSNNCLLLWLKLKSFFLTLWNMWAQRCHNIVAIMSGAG